ncbi:MAG: biotin transporter BioY [Oscillospiraceae bacterium]|nr:biotin transporter BioY [Oscillospiraceae bacterium]
MKTRDMALCALFAALLAVCAWLVIPIGDVPFTLQTFGVFAALGLLGGKRGTIAIAVYLLLGAVGAPVFAGFKSGVGALLGVTGGYLVSYIFMGLIVIAAEKLFGDRTIVFLIAGVIALIVCYAFGTAWFVVAYAKTAGPISWAAALGKCVIPFVLPDLAKLALAVFLRDRLKRYVPKTA